MYNAISNRARYFAFIGMKKNKRNSESPNVKLYAINIENIKYEGDIIVSILSKPRITQARTCPNIPIRKYKLNLKFPHTYISEVERE